jgi:hypothetical protein
MSYTVGQTIEVCLEFDLPPAQGLRRVVATFANESGEVTEFTEVPAGQSECVLQEPTQIGLRGCASHPGLYRLKRLRVESLSGITHVDPPRISFEVKGTPEVVGWHLA